ncbi:hypothetical protein ACJX0J_024729, partial [Zea mays]
MGFQKDVIYVETTYHVMHETQDETIMKHHKYNVDLVNIHMTGAVRNESLNKKSVKIWGMDAVAEVEWAIALVGAASVAGFRLTLHVVVCIFSALQSVHANAIFLTAYLLYGFSRNIGKNVNKCASVSSNIIYIYILIESSIFNLV